MAGQSGRRQLRDESARVLSSILAATDRAAALSLARAIGDETLRATTMDEVARHW
ncbi:hypothetical protein [Verrucomicrobium spinosum]|uniref:hypothetical protein n=1 Tax=Verrucomicrobium spinosum TaxID=2736 RepID=UPI000A49D3E3|nr:hypothetical protein [Verrucomicrobium spinosum]